ncbi:MAG: TetR/AcrR family transcriptional regulator [bacterium]|nr:TetR/AcrR family transcriptional regulator [bacterium]
MGKGADTRDTILARAVDLASRIGLQALSIGRLSEEVGMSKSGLFAHFGSKEALQMETLRTAADSLLHDVARPAFSEPRGEPRLRALVKRWLQWSRSKRMKGGCVFVHASAEFDDQPGPVRDLLLEQQQGWMGLLAESVERTIADGHFREEVDPAQVAFELNALILGYHYADRMLRDPQAEHRLWHAIDKLLASCR